MGWALSWDLDPLLQYLHLDKYLLQQYIQSNYEGLKISLCICILGKLWTKRHQKTKNLIATSQFSGVKAAYWAWFLHTAPPRGWGQYINHFFQLLDGSNPTLIQFKGPPCSSSPHASAVLREWARKHVTCFSSSVLHDKSQPCLAWISGLASYKFLLILRGPRALVGNKNYRKKVPKHICTG